METMLEDELHTKKNEGLQKEEGARQRAGGLGSWGSGWGTPQARGRVPRRPWGRGVPHVGG